jgi:hypothetical protein
MSDLKEKLKQIEASIKSLEPLVLQEHYDSMTEQQRNAMALAVQYALKGLIEDAQKEIEFQKASADVANKMVTSKQKRIDELKQKLQQESMLKCKVSDCILWENGDCSYGFAHRMHYCETYRRVSEKFEELLKEEKAKA